MSAYLDHFGLQIEPFSKEIDDSKLAAAGSSKEIFTSDAIAILHEAASGSLRDIDRVAHNALRISARKKRKLVERDIVQAVLQLD
jgi:type II secretory pathway predicted ATPase ExeA